MRLNTSSNRSTSVKVLSPTWRPLVIPRKAFGPNLLRRSLSVLLEGPSKADIQRNTEASMFWPDEKSKS